MTDRLLWCAKAAATMPSHPARTRFLTSLRKQFLPPLEGSGLRLSTHCFRSLTSNLFLLLSSLHTLPASSPDVDQRKVILSLNLSSPIAAEVHLVQDSINKLLSGSIEVDEQSIVEEYGTNSSTADSRNNEILKRALSIEALLHCIENCPGPGEWILTKMIEVFGCLLKFSISHLGHFSAILASTFRSKAHETARHDLHPTPAHILSGISNLPPIIT